MNGVKILSIGAYAPERVITNAMFNDWLKEDVGTWLEENVQIFERRWCRDDESVADLAESAARIALDRASLTAVDLDLIIVATDTPEYISPSTASILQDRLKATNAGTFDINTACAGFVTALDVASKYIMVDSHYQNILVIGAYAMSKYLNKRDKKTVTLFADGAGAVVLQSTKPSENAYLGSELRTRGEYNSWMGIYGGGTYKPISEEVLSQHDHQLKFVRKFPKELNPELWTDMIQKLCRDNDIKPRDIDHYFLTQININAIWETMDRLGVPRERAQTVMHYYGYTGSACIPMAFNQAYEKGIIIPGQKAVFMGSGGGLAFASALFTLS